MLHPVFLLLINDCELWVQRAQLLGRSDTWRVVGCYRGALQTLVEDARAEAEAGGIVGRGEDAALGLEMLGWKVWVHSSIWGVRRAITFIRSRTR